MRGLILIPVIVFLCSHGSSGQTQIPIYAVHLKNLLKMQQGIGWPLHLNVVRGHEALMKLSSTLENMQRCEVITPAGIQFNVSHPPNNRYERWSDGCGLRLKNVEAADHGRWRMIASSGDVSITGWSDLNIVEDTSSYTPTDQIALQDGATHAEVNLTTLDNSYCLVTQPFSESSLISGHCRVTLDRTTRAVQGRWHVLLGVPGRVSELQIERNVAVETEQLTPGYREDNAKLHLYCNIVHTHKNITFCRFQKNSGTAGFNIIDGLSDGRHSYYGGGFSLRQCGMTIENPSASDYSTWRCTVGLQEWNDTHIVQSAPMQALIRVAPRDNVQIGQNIERADDEIRTLFVKDGSSLTMMCRADLSLRYCWFQHPNGTQFTPVERLPQDQNDFWYAGESLQTGDCGITFSHVNEGDKGEWTCHMGPRNTLGVEVTDKILVRVTGPLAATEGEVDAIIGTEATLYCHTSNGRRPLDYCRFLSPNFVGISVDSTITAANAILNRFYFTPERNLDYGDCSLTINPVLAEDIGEWTCAAVIHDETEEARDKIVVFATVSTSTRTPLSTASIAAMIIGLIALVLILAGVVWYKKGKPIPWRRRRPNSHHAGILTDEFSLQSRNNSPMPRSSDSSGNSSSEAVQASTSETQTQTQTQAHFTIE